MTPLSPEKVTRSRGYTDTHRVVPFRIHGTLTEVKRDHTPPPGVPDIRAKEHFSP
jgi:hypothetical protein